MNNIFFFKIYFEQKFHIFNLYLPFQLIQLPWFDGQYKFDFISFLRVTNFRSGKINSVMENWRGMEQLLNNLFLTGIFNLWDIKIGRERLHRLNNLQAGLKIRILLSISFAAYGNNMEERFSVQILKLLLYFGISCKIRE